MKSIFSTGIEPQKKSETISLLLSSDPVELKENSDTLPQATVSVSDPTFDKTFSDTSLPTQTEDDTELFSEEDGSGSKQGFAVFSTTNPNIEKPITYISQHLIQYFSGDIGDDFAPLIFNDSALGNVDYVAESKQDENLTVDSTVGSTIKTSIPEVLTDSKLSFNGEEKKIEPLRNPGSLFGAVMIYSIRFAMLGFLIGGTTGGFFSVAGAVPSLGLTLLASIPIALVVGCMGLIVGGIIGGFSGVYNYSPQSEEPVLKSDLKQPKPLRSPSPAYIRMPNHVDPSTPTKTIDLAPVYANSNSFFHRIKIAKKLKKERNTKNMTQKDVAKTPSTKKSFFL